MNKDYKPTVVFDFDGVIHSYKSGWKGIDIIPDPPVKGIKELIDELRKEFNIVIVSTRCSTNEGILAVNKYLRKYDINVDKVQMDKPPAICYVDDRAIKFDPKNISILFDEIKGFKNWIEREKEEQ